MKSKLHFQSVAQNIFNGLPVKIKDQAHKYGLENILISYLSQELAIEYQEGYQDAKASTENTENELDAYNL